MFDNSVLKAKIKKLEEDNKYLNQLVDHDRGMKKAQQGGTLLIDFSKIEVICIERCPFHRGANLKLDDVWITLITYRREELENSLPVKKHREMHFFTDVNQHNKIVLDYNEFLKEKEKEKKKK
jgi:hypothetical protein